MKRQTQQKTTTVVVQQTEKLPDYLEPFRHIIAQVGAFVNGDASVLNQLRADVAKARDAKKDDRDNLNRALAKLVINGAPMTLITDVLEEKSGKWLTNRLGDLLACAKAVNVTVNELSWKEAKYVYDLYVEQHPPTKTTFNPFAILSSHGSARTPFPWLEAWVYPRPRVTKDQAKDMLDNTKKQVALETQIDELDAQKAKAVEAEDFAKAGEIAAQLTTLRQELANLTTAPTATTEVDDEEDVVGETIVVPTLESRIAELDAQKADAVKAEDFAKAGELQAQLVVLRQELASTTATVEEVVSTTATEAPATAPATEAIVDRSTNGGTEFTLDDAIDLCTSENASADLKRLLERRTMKPGEKKWLNDASFLKKVAVLTGNGNNIATETATA